ncbi:hypothetical protein LIER_09075 [Lithospermum erythrorhizon]|uniref:Retrovirus-related Pol polyprotein from transposon TNT 1-94-like beta-barrel domain-containing protein n=1 Tax=Lithospermum erythrorhizon TaxID=34254 RepID=A0AAV3PEE7_LITER
MMFYLTTMSLSKFLTEEPPKLQEGESNLQFVYRTLPTAKSVWDALEYKYITQDVGVKKFIVVEYKMIDGKSIDSQVQELQVIFSEIHAEGMVISEGFHVAAIIEKVPPGWKDFKNYLKHKRKEITVKEVALRLRIKEDNRKEMTTEANGPKLVTEAGANKGYKSSECRFSKKKKNAYEANMIKIVTSGLSDINLSAMVSEVNLVGSNLREWWVATRHIYSPKEVFTNFKPLTNGEKMYMDNSSTSNIEGEGTVVLKMTLGKEVTLNHVLYVLDVRKNLIASSLL